MVLKQYATFLFSILLLIQGGKVSIAQETKPETFSVDATVYGYYFNPSKKIFKKERQVALEGTLKGVDVFIYHQNNLIQTAKTNPFGEFTFDLRIGKVYKLVLTKTNYSKCILMLDLESIPSDVSSSGIAFHGLELILNSYVIKDSAVANLPFAKLFYNHRKKQIDFEINKPPVKKGFFVKKEEESTTPADLLKKSVLKNKITLNPTLVEEPITKSKVKKNKKSSIYVPPDNSDNKSEWALKKTYVPRKYYLDPNTGLEKITKQTVAEKQKELALARKRLELDKLNATTAEDSLAILEAEIVLNSRTIELQNALRLIQLQEKEITTQQNIIYLVIFSSILLLAFLIILFKFYTDKKKTTVLLDQKNKKITDSINYAKRIQDSVLLNENEIAAILPNSFVFFQPRDIVSGDFYWFSEHDGKVIVAAIDCTGHGVPGAFLSLIGNSLLNEIIYEKKIIQPAKILELLHLGVLKLLHQNTDDKSMDGMELSICLIDKEQQNIVFAGAMTPIYIVKNNKVLAIDPDIQSIGGIHNLTGKQKEIIFTEKQIKIEKDMCLYLFTDGYMDQFGEKEERKYNTSNFKKILLEIQSLDAANQKRIIEQTLVEWRGNSRQVDDILVIGIKF